MSHTKGPWTVDQRCIQAPDGNIALLNLARPEAETQANAKLIAQAPLLPEAIEALRRASEALAEAREMLGVFEDHGGHDGLGGKGYVATIDHMDEARKAARAILQRYEEAAK